jgi:hypothetical protein
LLPFISGGFVTLPVIGLYYSLRRVHFISALLSTILVGLFLPHFLRLVFGLMVQILLFSNDYQSPFRPQYAALTGSLLSPFFINIFQAGIAVLIGSKLHRDLVQRNFAYSKPAN